MGNNVNKVLVMFLLETILEQSINKWSYGHTGKKFFYCPVSRRKKKSEKSLAHNYLTV